MRLQHCTCEICGKSYLFGVDENGELIGYHRQLCSSFCNGVASGRKALTASLNAREEELERLKAEVDDLKVWKQSAIAVQHAWDAAWIAAGKPGKLGESMAATIMQEIHRLKAENAAQAAEIGWLRKALKNQQSALMLLLDRQCHDGVVTVSERDVRLGLKQIDAALAYKEPGQ